MTEFYRLEKRVSDLEETVRRLEMHVRNIMQTDRYHDEALTAIFDRAEETWKKLDAQERKTAEKMAEYKT